jgi:hypothetical protein
MRLLGIAILASIAVATCSLPPFPPEGMGGMGTGGSGGNGGSNDPANSVNFWKGRAQGIMTGYAYIALGASDTVTDPVCAEDPKDLATTRPITGGPWGSCIYGGTCPTTGQTVWNAPDRLCITGSIPKVVGGDYNGNWGLEIGVNTKDPPATSAGSGTLGKTYTHMTFTTTGTIEPANTAIRPVIHLVDMACDANPYCATMSASGKAMTLTSFNTKCWDGSGTALTAADIPNIDKIGIQIWSDTANVYTVTDYCLTGIQFDNN